MFFFLDYNLLLCVDINCTYLRCIQQDVQNENKSSFNNHGNKTIRLHLAHNTYSISFKNKRKKSTFSL